MDFPGLSVMAVFKKEKGFRVSASGKM